MVIEAERKPNGSYQSNVGLAHGTTQLSNLRGLEGQYQVSPINLKGGEGYSKAPLQEQADKVGKAMETEKASSESTPIQEKRELWVNKDKLGRDRISTSNSKADVLQAVVHKQWKGLLMNFELPEKFCTKEILSAALTEGYSNYVDLYNPGCIEHVYSRLPEKVRENKELFLSLLREHPELILARVPFNDTEEFLIEAYRANPKIKDILIGMIRRRRLGGGEEIIRRYEEIMSEKQSIRSNSKRLGQYEEAGVTLLVEEETFGKNTIASRNHTADVLKAAKKWKNFLSRVYLPEKFCTEEILNAGLTGLNYGDQKTYIDIYSPAYVEHVYSKLPEKVRKNKKLFLSLLRKHPELILARTLFIRTAEFLKEAYDANPKIKEILIKAVKKNCSIEEVWRLENIYEEIMPDTYKD